MSSAPRRRSTASRGGTVAGPTVFGGQGHDYDEQKTVVFSRGGCYFSTKIAAGQDLGYDVVIIGQSHGGARNGLLPDAFFCGGQGHDYDEQIPAVCIGHRAMHLMFNDAPTVHGCRGCRHPSRSDGRAVYGQHGVRRLGLRTAPRRSDAEPGHHRLVRGARGPRRGLRRGVRDYTAGARVGKFSHSGGIREVGFFIDEAGNHFWGTFPHRLQKSQGAPLLLYILRYEEN